MDTRSTVRFYVNGKRHDVAPASATQTVLQYLREQVHLNGTKEGCAEGDCGACTIMQAELDARNQVQYRAINACIRFLPTLDGRAIWTVEGVAPSPGRLHPVQQAMVDHHGSQCGFCTPGFVMSLYTLYRQGQCAPSRDQVLDTLSGNLCRCTGYRPIIDAAMNMGAYPVVQSDDAAVHALLQGLRDQAGQEGMLAIRAGDQQYFAPRSANELAGLYQQFPQATLLAGGTDVGLWVTKQLQVLPTVIYVGDAADLNHIAVQDGHLVVAAGVLLNDAFQALAQHYPQATELWKRFASMPIRNSGTLVGNIANGSPIGDGAPFLIALGAQVVLRKGQARRTLPLDDLYLDYRKQNREPGEFVESLRIPLLDNRHRLATYKVSKRIDQDISAVCGAYAVQIHNATVQHCRIAYGGMAATTRRAVHAEQALIGQPWNEQTVRLAMQALQNDYQPLTDMRAGASYRLTVAQNLLLRFYLESACQGATRVHEVHHE